jgi:hypothetical protein
MIEKAKRLAAIGFHVFPLIPGSKKPLIKDFPTKATRDVATIEKWWKNNPQANIGISTSKFLEAEALVAIDLDDKGDSHGSEEALRLELEGKDFPKTFTQTTVSGGKHLIYRNPFPVRQGAHVLARGIDVRSSGGYLVGSGSVIEGRIYTDDNSGIHDTPEWIISACGRRDEPKTNEEETLKSSIVSDDRAIARAISYLTKEAPVSVQGVGGDQTSFMVACRIKDIGVSEFTCTELMYSLWNDKCSPPWSYTELAQKVRNAYRYGSEKKGVAAPENQFTKIEDKPKAEENDEALSPIQRINKEYAFIIVGGHSSILHETEDAEGYKNTNFIGVQAFHDKFEPHKLVFDDKTKNISKVWMASKERRSYDGVCFDPSNRAPKRYYNTWRGMSVSPISELEASNEAKESLAAFLNHSLENICCGDKDLNHWLMSYFAHMIQKPWEKPTVALVFKGGKGVGKNALVDRVGKLFGSHYIVTADKRYLVGNFNSHLQQCILIALDEAFWSGDKQAEGALKNLISGNKHVIEQKGREAFQSKNCTRVCIIGNEDWLVPASDDERRYTVFNVGDGRKQDTKFFREMREGMERGGYGLLLDYFQKYNIEDFDISKAYLTKGLMEQKLVSLSPFDQFWYECLSNGRIICSDFDDEWPEKNISKDRFRRAFQRYLKENSMNTFGGGSAESIGRSIRKRAKIKSAQERTDEGKVNVYVIPSLKECREAWELTMNHKIEWDS